MILSDREVRAAEKRKAIGISDCPQASDKRWSSTTLGLTLDTEIRTWKQIGGSGLEAAINPSGGDFNSNELIAKYTEKHSCEGEGFVLNGKSFVLGWTAEKIKLPNTSRIAARVEGKSSLARIGLGIYVTAPIIHPGFGEGTEPDYPGSPMRLEIWNIGPLDIKGKKRDAHLSNRL